MRNHSNTNPALNSSTFPSQSVKPLLPMKAALAVVPNAITQPSIQILNAQHPQRPVTQDFIKSIFKTHHNANVSSFLPSLFTIFNEQGKAQSALGIKGASQGSLYLEQYLNDPIEHLLSSTLGEAVTRREVVEIGNLASQNSASCKALFAHVAQHLHQQKIKWITCTGTATLRVVFKHLGIKALAIHEADQNRLGDEQYSWGNYYQNDPQVMLINVSETHQHFNNVKKAIKQKNTTH